MKIIDTNNDVVFTYIPYNNVHHNTIQYNTIQYNALVYWMWCSRLSPNAIKYNKYNNKYDKYNNYKIKYIKLTIT